MTSTPTLTANPHTNIHTAGGAFQVQGKQSFKRETWEPLSVKTLRTQLSGFKGLFQVASSQGLTFETDAIKWCDYCTSPGGRCFPKPSQGFFQFQLSSMVRSQQVRVSNQRLWRLSRRQVEPVSAFQCRKLCQGENISPTRHCMAPLQLCMFLLDSVGHTRGKYHSQGCSSSPASSGLRWLIQYLDYCKIEFVPVICDISLSFFLLLWAAPVILCLVP